MGTSRYRLSAQLGDRPPVQVDVPPTLSADSKKEKAGTSCIKAATKSPQSVIRFVRQAARRRTLWRESGPVQRFWTGAAREARDT